MSLVSALNTLVALIYLLSTGQLDKYLSDMDKASGVGFILGIFCFIEAVLFAYFTFEMTYECCDVLESNQTYID